MGAQELLRYMVEVGASDLHLRSGSSPFVRVDGELEPCPFPALSATDTETLATELLPLRKASEFSEIHEADAGFSLPGVGRFRVNVFRQRGEVSLAIRRVRGDIPSFEELRLPDVVGALAEAPRGLVLVTGPAGTGKTTTIASMIGHINATRRSHIVTIEDPIEVVHEDHLSIVDQREIGVDTVSFASALRHVIRQDPDVIFIGEIRDSETAEAALSAAETGHLVISTLHTIDATETINRMLDLLPASAQRQARFSLGASLKGTVSQRLVPRADGKGRVPAVEVLVNTGRVHERILDANATNSITEVIAEGEFYGMQTFDQALVKLVVAGVVTEEDARDVASNPHDFSLALRGSELRGSGFPPKQEQAPERDPGRYDVAVGAHARPNYAPTAVSRPPAPPREAPEDDSDAPVDQESTSAQPHTGKSKRW